MSAAITQPDLLDMYGKVDGKDSSSMLGSKRKRRSEGGDVNKSALEAPLSDRGSNDDIEDYTENASLCMENHRARYPEASFWPKELTEDQTELVLKPFTLDDDFDSVIEDVLEELDRAGGWVSETPVRARKAYAKII